MRECKICHKNKSVESFYIRKSGRNEGWIFKECKNCFNLLRRQKYLENIEEERVRLRIKMARYRKNGSFALAMRRWRDSHPKHIVKRKVRDILKYAVNKGELTRGTCKICRTNENIEAHHKDYSKPLEVEWYCKKHHGVIEGRYYV